MILTFDNDLSDFMNLKDKNAIAKFNVFYEKMHNLYNDLFMDLSHPETNDSQDISYHYIVFAMHIFGNYFAQMFSMIVFRSAQVENLNNANIDMAIDNLTKLMNVVTKLSLSNLKSIESNFTNSIN